jgi:hypothetical protein
MVGQVAERNLDWFLVGKCGPYVTQQALQGASYQEESTQFSNPHTSYTFSIELGEILALNTKPCF